MNNVIFFSTITQPRGVANYVTIIILLLIFAGLIVFIFGTIFSMKNTNLTLTDRELIIKSVFYGRKIPLENILAKEARAINLNHDAGFSISIRTNGIGLPGFKLGWMKLKNGDKALVYLTDVNNVLLLPTKNFTLLFSMNNIEEFIQKINGSSEG